MAKLSDIEGIGEVYAGKLKEAGITTQDNLLKACCEKKGRKAIATQTGISEKMLLNWVNRADLARVKGISTQYADLLEYAGVDTVPELAQRNADNLAARMSDVNEAKKLVRKVPTGNQVAAWVEQAKVLPRAVNH